MQNLSTERIAFLKEQQAKDLLSIRKRIYGNNYFHTKGFSLEADARLERFEPLRSKGEITLSYVRGLKGTGTQLQIQGDGSITVVDHGTTRKVGTLEQGRCAEFFRRVITSGLLNYSDQVIEIKRDLAPPYSFRMQSDATIPEFRIRIPELDIDKVFSIDGEFESRNYPDIIEYKLAAALEEEIDRKSVV